MSSPRPEAEGADGPARLSAGGAVSSPRPEAEGADGPARLSAGGAVSSPRPEAEGADGPAGRSTRLLVISEALTEYTAREAGAASRAGRSKENHVTPPNSSRAVAMAHRSRRGVPKDAHLRADRQASETKNRRKLGSNLR